ncbi:MAG: HAMP domain-containing protein, partial [Burkholderiales bacterium]
MRLAAGSVRARLTLWYAGALALLIIPFSAGIYLCVGNWLYLDLDRELENDLRVIEEVYREEPGDLPQMETRHEMRLFEVRENGRRLFATTEWERGGFGNALPRDVRPAPRSWVSPQGIPFRVAELSRPPLYAAIAIDEVAVRQPLRTLAEILLLGVLCAVGLALAGGYFLAGRALAPIGAMADKAVRITAESLGDRLPVQNPGDELGRLASVFNDLLLRVQTSFEQLRRFTADASHELRTPL